MAGTVKTIEPATPTAVIDRISLVLDAFEGPGRLTLAQIVRRTGLPRSSAHRMLDRLVQLRWLRRSGRDYELGMRLVELGSLAVHQDRLVRAAAPLLGADTDSILSTLLGYSADQISKLREDGVLN